MSLSTLRCDAASLRPWAAQLRALERGIAYPIADGADAFTIDHGAVYHPFFSAMGRAHFGLCLAGTRVVGSIAAVEKPIVTPHGVRVDAIYLGDLKAHPDYRGGRATRPLLARCVKELVLDRSFHRARFLFAAAMRGHAGDVMRSATGLHPGRAFRPYATLAVFFADPATLAALPGDAPLPGGRPLDLSPDAGEGVVSTAGRKEFVLRSTGAPWRLVHLVTKPGAGWARGLREGGAALRAEAGAVACFAVDARLTAVMAWLAGHGVVSGATCTVYAFGLPPVPWRPAWVHLATSEI